MRKLSVVILLAVGSLVLTCSNAHAIPITFTAVLNAANENPPTASPGTGFATVTIDSVSNLMTVDVSFQDLVIGNTAAHIHCCTTTPLTGNAGVATTTPTFTGFPTGATAGIYNHTFDMTLATSYNPAFITANGGTPASAEIALFNGIIAGRTYLNIHTSANPGGEIRGFLVPAAVPEPTSLVLLGTGLLGAVARYRRKKGD